MCIRDRFATEVPGVDAAGTTWVRPGLVVDVNSLGVNSSGRLRQPSYRGRRLDLTPADLADGPDEGTVGPVSYTHLDVYKRQQ